MNRIGESTQYGYASLIQKLVAAPGPPGQEDAVRAVTAAQSDALGCRHRTDARGNLLIAPPGVSEIPEQADIVVLAHLDEIAMVVQRIEPDGQLAVLPLGGLFPWKIGESPVQILAPGGPLTGVLSFGSIHSNSPANPGTRAKEGALGWEGVRVFTGQTQAALVRQGVRPGTRVVLHPSRRTVTEFGDFLAAPFLDDRADIAAMLLTLETLADQPPLGSSVVFAATAAEEVGGHGALSLLRRLQPEVVIALEIGPNVTDAPVSLTAAPTVWTHDGYATMQAGDIELTARAAEDAGLAVQWQALSRGGSDASCAASHGLADRPFTLAFPAGNSHGLEIVHRDAVPNLARLLTALLGRLCKNPV